MSVLPRDKTDLYLAPVLLALEERISEFAALAPNELGIRIALTSDLPDWTAEQRSRALLVAIGHLIELHGWLLSWDESGLKVAHGDRVLVLSTPPSLAAYVRGA